jgi:uncharacterized membrane protein YsdA (DUF1294 family)
MSLYWYFLLALLFLNLLAFYAYWSDKRKAKKGKWRTSEAMLLALSLLGPFGAFAGMRAFHHKTKKLKFVLVPVFMLLQIALFVWAFLYLD